METTLLLQFKSDIQNVLVKELIHGDWNHQILQSRIQKLLSSGSGYKGFES